MARAPNPRNWKGEDITSPLCPANVATPSAALSLLAAAVAYPIDAATTPYVGCARLFDSNTALSPGVRYLGVRIAPAAKAARAAITRACVPSFSTGVGSPPFDNLCWSAYGGSSGADIITVSASADFPGYGYSSIADRAFDFASTAKSQQIVLTSDADVPAPVSTQDRMFELQALAYPKIEPMYVTNAAGFSVVVVRRVADLTGL